MIENKWYDPEELLKQIYLEFKYSPKQEITKENISNKISFFCAKLVYEGYITKDFSDCLEMFLKKRLEII